MLRFHFFQRKAFRNSVRLMSGRIFKLSGLTYTILLTNGLRDGVRPSVFPTNKDAVMVDIDVILRDLNNKIENF